MVLYMIALHRLGEKIWEKIAKSVTWKYFVGYHHIALPHVRDEVCSRCLPKITKLTKDRLKAKQVPLKQDLFVGHKPLPHREHRAVH